MTFRHLLLPLAIAAGTLLAACASSSDSVRRAKEANAQGPVRATEEAAEFMVEMVDARRMDYAEGALAITHATTPELRAYGAQMTRDQTLLLDELNAIAFSLRVQVPKEISEAKAGPLRGLTEQQGKDFDKRFMSMITIDHERDVKAFTKAMAFDRDPVIADFAKRRLPLVQSHLDAIKAIRDDYK